MARRRSKKIKRAVVFALLVACMVVIAAEFSRVGPKPTNPLARQLAPGAGAAVIRALGSGSLSRLTQVISEDNKRTWYSAGTHLASGVHDGSGLTDWHSISR